MLTWRTQPAGRQAALPQLSHVNLLSGSIQITTITYAYCIARGSERHLRLVSTEESSGGRRELHPEIAKYEIQTVTAELTWKLNGANRHARRMEGT